MQNVTAPHGHGTRRRARILITLTLGAYRFLWIVIVVLHAVHAIAFGNEAWIFLNTMANGSELNRGLQVYRLGNTFNTSVSAAMLVSSSCVCFWHGASVLRALVWSLRYKKLAFFRLINESDRGASRGLRSRKMRQISGAVTPPLRRMYSIWSGVFSLDSKYFDNVRDVRELVETVSQTYMVYFTNKSIASRILTSFGVIVLLLNCWSTPLIDRVWQKDESKVRYFHLLVNMLLACCFTIVMRAMEYYVYIIDYAQPRYYNLEWTVNSLSQLLHMSINTWLEMIMNRANLLSMTIAMETLKSRVRQPHQAHLQQSTLLKPSTIVPADPAPRRQASPEVTLLPVVANPSARRRRMLFYVYGAAVFGIHLSSSLRSPFVQPRDGAICHVEVRPWLQKYASCLALELNCHRLGIQGSAAEIDAELRNVNKIDLKALVVSHCPRVEMPPLIQELENLFGLEIYNSTIVRWDEDAALSMSFHPSLAVLRLILVQGITELPPGLVAPNFPATDVEIVLTDLAALPDDLETKWPHKIAALTIEGSRLGKVPEFVTEAQISRLFLGSNGIQAVSSSLFLDRSYEMLMLSGNPIQELPSSLLLPTEGGNGSFHCVELLIQATAITEIPDWVFANTTSVAAGSTPFCSLNPSAGHAVSGHTVDCTPFPYAIALGFPLTLHSQLRLP